MAFGVWRTHIHNMCVMAGDIKCKIYLKHRRIAAKVSLSSFCTIRRRFFSSFHSQSKCSLLLFFSFVCLVCFRLLAFSVCRFCFSHPFLPVMFAVLTLLPVSRSTNIRFSFQILNARARLEITIKITENWVFGAYLIYSKVLRHTAMLKSVQQRRHNNTLRTFGSLYPKMCDGNFMQTEAKKKRTDIQKHFHSLSLLFLFRLTNACVRVFVGVRRFFSLEFWRDTLVNCSPKRICLFYWWANQ